MDVTVNSEPAPGRTPQNSEPEKSESSMSEENTPAMAAFAKHYERTAGAPLKMPESWDMQPEAVRADWEATAEAVAPAYAMLLDRYRQLIDRATVVIACHAGRVKFANELRAEAGLEALAPLADIADVDL